VISRLTTDRLALPPVSNDTTADVALDLKYSITKSVTADFTYNTDFAQVEADEVQVNLTRFNLQFPEKRDFFLEGQGTFVFGTTGSGAAPTPGSSQPGGASDAPTIFYSRRIGLSGAHRLHRPAPPPRHPAAQRHRRDRHPSPGVHGGAGREHPRRRRQ